MLNFWKKKASFMELFAEYQARQDAILLDVRTVEEYEDGHIPNSVLLPLSKITQYDGDKQLPIYAYCRSGNRSAQACHLLKEKGYEVYNLGGILDYEGPIAK